MQCIEHVESGNLKYEFIITFQILLVLVVKCRWLCVCVFSAAPVHTAEFIKYSCCKYANVWHYSMFHWILMIGRRFNIERVFAISLQLPDQ